PASSRSTMTISTSESSARNAPTKCSPLDPAPSTTTRPLAPITRPPLAQEETPRGVSAERAGFEPATHLSARTRFPVALLRPLGHLSVAPQQPSRPPASVGSRFVAPLQAPGGQMRVLVVGAGIGGLTLALALRRRGIGVDVFERAPDAERVAVGGGLHLWPNGMRGLREAGVDDRVP